MVRRCMHSFTKCLAKRHDHARPYALHLCVSSSMLTHIIAGTSVHSCPLHSHMQMHLPCFAVLHDRSHIIPVEHRC